MRLNFGSCALLFSPLASALSLSLLPPIPYESNRIMGNEDIGCTFNVCCMHPHSLQLQHDYEFSFVFSFFL